MELTIFTKQAGKDGQGTLMFYNVSNFIDKKEYIGFTYKSNSTGKIKNAIFLTANIAGWAKE